MRTPSLRMFMTAGVVGLMATSAFAGNAANLMFPLDGTYSVVPYARDGNPLGGNGPAAAADPLARNDDDSIQLATGGAGVLPQMPGLPFNFNLYGTNFTGNQVWVNNNGNLSFGAGFPTFTASGFPVNGFPMVAPFWGDVDTRAAASGTSYYKMTANTLIVTWDNVGYYNTHADRTNTFQVAISDGTNPTMGLGNNVCFSYDSMNWTTGDASGGVGGFGGTPATVGVNRGNGVNFFQIGRFDQNNANYDGPGGNNDGVHYLDGLDTCFRVDGQTNQPPIWVNNPGVITLDVSLAQSLNYVGQFIGPEGGDIVTITGVADPNNAQGAGLNIVNAVGNPATSTLTWTPDAGDIGVYNLTYTFQDNFLPPNVSNGVLQIRVIPEPATMALLGLALVGLRRKLGR